MNKTALFFLFFLLIAGSVRSQDKIVRKNGDTLLVKVIGLSPLQVEYKNLSTSDTDVHVILKSDASRIVYESGLNEVFDSNNDAHKTSVIAANKDADSYSKLYSKGEQDATMYYKDYHGAKTGTCLMTAFSPLYGLATALACVNTPPKTKSLGCPFPEMMTKTAYMDAYSHKAYQIKKKQTWRGFGTGAAISGGLTLLFVGLLVAAYH